MNKQPESETDDRSYGELSYEECLRRLATRSIGRLSVMVGNYPQVFVVNYRLDEFIVAFRTHSGTKLDAANHANISFQVDHIDETTRTGWSVLILGMAEDVTDRVADPITERTRDLRVDPWVPGEQPRLVRIVPAHITGRELTQTDLAYWSDDRGYL
jgi:nitroimidazol reductase NimA-like FMN-containing flavoprotein (pyridoxamine 5'-phosphate oxidase superfamily)